jgi:hypothetical protein
MNAAVAFYLAHEGLTAGRPPRRRAPRLSRALLLAAAAVAILLVTLGGDALADPARSGATAQPGGDRFAGVATAKEKQSAGNPGAKKKGAKPGAKKKGAKPGAKKKGGKKKGGKKKGGKKKGEPGARGRPTDPHTLFYKAEITGAFRYQQTWDSGGSDTGSASLRGGRASVRLARDEITNPMTGRTAYFYDVDVIGGGELSGASRTDSSPPTATARGGPSRTSSLRRPRSASL